MKAPSYLLAVLLFVPIFLSAQVNTGSDGSDGVLNPQTDLVIDMADHPNGIYQYSSVNVPTGVTVTFVPNVHGPPVVWLVQTSVLVDGTVDVSGHGNIGLAGGLPGPGGWRGGEGGQQASDGEGPGGGPKGTGTSSIQNGKFLGSTDYLIPLLGGSGGGGTDADGSNFNIGDEGGGGGGGAILIAASEVTVNGIVRAGGGHGGYYASWGSGGAIRIVAAEIAGTGSFDTNTPYGNNGRIRFDSYHTIFSGQISGEFSQGFQPIIIPPVGVGAQLRIVSVAGQAVTTTPTGELATPDVVISSEQTNPVPIVVECENVPLNSLIYVNVKPLSGETLSSLATRNGGTDASSTATTNFNLPRGGGLIWAQATIGLFSSSASSVGGNNKHGQSYSKTGLTVGGERFEKMEITAVLGGEQRITYLTESGKRIPALIR